MKTLFKNLFLFLIIGSISGCMMAQHRGNGNVISKTYELSSFDRISASGSFSVILTQSGEQQIVIKVDENLVNQLEVRVVNGELQLSNRSIQNATKLVAEINIPSISAIDASGATDIKTTNKFSGSEIEIDASGASDILFMGDYSKIDIDLSGASNLTLIGTGKTMRAEISGASDLKAGDFKVLNASVEASGASDATVNVKETLNADESGASDIHNTQHKKN
jgi:hypothetical protein